MAVWSGQVTLTDLKLRREACYALGLPFSIKAGYIEHVELSIPWNKLGSEPVVTATNAKQAIAAAALAIDSDSAAPSTVAGPFARSASF